ncbi:ATPase domain protein, prokaryote domain protein [Candidatus Magnetobacterium bavaricum]|uniref:ATPase domain protein, prokaryote domain protein n=1 Tax=Candidatus Magnetobacterium bavaricum TaxID=29290 RepID=A0A0F3GJJ3_9BACT|nr:ATPase domain protein, prokaryote domain protein [Candidatus Magnetobacterium bavaricum]
MENIAGNFVCGANYLRTRLYLVDDLRRCVERTSVLIDAPRRFGKTSVVKELERQEKEKEDFHVLFFNLQGTISVHEFYEKCLDELIKLYKVKNMLTKIKDFASAFIDGLSGTIESIETPVFSMNLRERTRDMKPEDLKKLLEPIIQNLNSLDKRTVLIFDEFPDLLLDIKNNAPSHENYVKTVDNLTAWLRKLRQSSSSENKYQFVFCGSINIRNVLRSIGLTNRINDLESLKVPPLEKDEPKALVDALLQPKGISVDPDALDFLISKIKGSSVYYGQFIVKALIEKRQTSFTLTEVTNAYNEMIHSDNNNLSQFRERLTKYLDPIQQDCAKKVLKTLCNGALDEQQLHTLHASNIIADFDEFHEVVERLIFEGYLLEDATDAGKLRFASPVLKDWWSRRRS